MILFEAIRSCPNLGLLSRSKSQIVQLLLSDLASAVRAPIDRKAATHPGRLLSSLLSALLSSP